MRKFNDFTHDFSFFSEKRNSASPVTRESETEKEREREEREREARGNYPSVGRIS